jgi:hypothetical protein
MESSSMQPEKLGLVPDNTYNHAWFTMPDMNMLLGPFIPTALIAFVL